MPLLDTFGRPLRNLRLSVTDRCNLRCAYCMPEKDYVWLPREDLLHFEEISTLVDVFVALGVDKLRLTGGEPLLRRDLRALVRMLAAKPGLADLALTTNGVLLAEQADALSAAGLGRITVSLDTLRADRFTALTRFDALDAVLEGMDAASRAFGRFKIDTVVIRGVNDDELVDLIEYGRPAERRGAVHRVHGRRRRHALVARGRGVAARDAGDASRPATEPIEPIVEDSSAPADRFALPDGTVFGIISSTTDPFCRSCDRSRLTADGMWYLCLYAARGIDLRAALRRGATAEELTALIDGRWQARTDRGAEGSARAGRAAGVRPAHRPAEGSPPRDAHARRLGPLPALRLPPRQPSVPPAPAGRSASRDGQHESETACSGSRHSVVQSPATASRRSPR